MSDLTINVNLDYEDIVCACGNEPHLQGFDTVVVFEDGTVVACEPTVEGPWNGLYRCGQCNRLHMDALPVDDKDRVPSQ